VDNYVCTRVPVRRVNSNVDDVFILFLQKQKWTCDCETIQMVLLRHDSELKVVQVVCVCLSLQYLVLQSRMSPFVTNSKFKFS